MSKTPSDPTNYQGTVPAKQIKESDGSLWENVPPDGIVKTGDEIFVHGAWVEAFASVGLKVGGSSVRRRVRIPEIHLGDSLDDIAEAVWQNAEAHGFHGPNEDGHVSTPAERLMLIVSECSEALEELRRPGKLDMCAFQSELADIIIRTPDLAQDQGIDIEAAVVEKHNINRLRPLRHGGKKL